MALFTLSLCYCDCSETLQKDFVDPCQYVCNCMKYLLANWFPILLGCIIIITVLPVIKSAFSPVKEFMLASDKMHNKNEWEPPLIDTLSESPENDLILYGRELIANTAMYLGPKGKVAAISNGLNCQNCHIEAGARSYGNCFSAVASIYPVFRPRSGIVESIEFRVNDCMKRSMNGQTIDSLGREMRAIVAYLKWLGKDVPKGVKPKGANTEDIPFLKRAADPDKGKVVYLSKCQVCHGTDGKGVLKPDSTGFIYPPLWGPSSYNTGAGLYRLSRFASYVKHNMPFPTASYDNPQLTDEEAWDLAAFVNSQPRPDKKFNKDWPDLSKKAMDHPYGPYLDDFSEKQHKYGPFLPIKKAREATAMKK